MWSNILNTAAVNVKEGKLRKFMKGLYNSQYWLILAYSFIWKDEIYMLMKDLIIYNLHEHSKLKRNIEKFDIELGGKI